MSETVAVAMAMPHCNILFAARPLTLAAASKPGKSRRGEGGEAATGSSGMLITPSPRFVLHYAGDNAPGQRVYVSAGTQQTYAIKHAHA